MVIPEQVSYGTVTGPTFVRPIRAMVVARRVDGTRIMKSVTALRWVPLPPTVVFTPDPVQPHEA
jgi:hypothetical protein